MNIGVDRYIDWKDWRDDSFGKFDPLLARYLEAETGISAGPGVRVLEIGFGNGPLIGWLHSIGVEIFGVELNAVLVDRCRRLLGEGRAFTDLNDDRLTADAGSFTHIVAFDVIEHISQDDLPNFLTRLKSLLAARGCIILRFPNGDSPFGRIYQHGDPTHVTTIGRSKIAYFAQQTGLAVKDIRAPRLPMTGISMGRGIKRRLVSAGRYCVERVVGILYFGGRPIPLDPNYIAVLVHADPGQPTPRP
jgi:2-polyprenyl-3-methyl-5-hydroxy-6-metoxy-1,4-benzoquinol methylase